MIWLLRMTEGAALTCDPSADPELLHVHRGALEAGGKDGALLIRPPGAYLSHRRHEMTRR